MTLLTDARVLELARKFEQYPSSLEPTLRGTGIVEFARALLAEHEASKVYTRPGTVSAPAAPGATQ